MCICSVVRWGPIFLVVLRSGKHANQFTRAADLMGVSSISRVSRTVIQKPGWEWQREEKKCSLSYRWLPLTGKDVRGASRSVSVGHAMLGRKKKSQKGRESKGPKRENATGGIGRGGPKINIARLLPRDLV